MVPLLTNKIPPEGTLARCPHDVYLAGSVDGKSLYCGLCNPSRIIPDVQEVHLPRSSGDRLTTDGVLQANKRAGSACPACGSYVWMRSKEDGPDTRRECAECGTAYSVRLSVHHQVEQMLAEMQAE
jgi:Zn ribbon nucleic-acid-binding protein